MTAAEITARLVKVNAAIDFVLDGNVDSAGIAGRSLTMLSLDTLEKMRARYEAELVAVNDGASRPMLVRFQSPT